MNLLAYKHYRILFSHEKKWDTLWMRSLMKKNPKTRSMGTGVSEAEEGGHEAVMEVS